MYTRLCIISPFARVARARDDKKIRGLQERWPPHSLHVLVWGSRLCRCHIASLVSEHHQMMVCHRMSRHRTSYDIISHDVTTSYDMIWHDITTCYHMIWHDITTSYDMTSDMIWHDITTWYDLTWHDIITHDMTWHHQMMLYDVTGYDMTSLHVQRWEGLSVCACVTYVLVWRMCLCDVVACVR